MRALLPDASDSVDLHAWYGSDWLDRGGVRANMISSVDGAASAAGLSGGLQTPGDNRIFATLRDLADVVLVGSGTVRAEGYGPVRFSEERVAVRTAHRLAETLPIAVVSRSLNLDTSLKLFVESRPGDRSLVLTTSAASGARRRVLEEVTEVVDVGEHDIDPARVRAVLGERSFTRVLCEGGPTLLGQFAAAGEIDELCLSLSPVVAGPGAPRIICGDGWDAGPRRFTLRALLEEDGALFLRLAAPRRDH
jgi:riboflavin biosynthesis pyrimidine reductase